MAPPPVPPVPGVALIILDGWGLAPAGPGNAISLANTPTFDRLWDEHPHTTLTAQGRAVGLPEGQMGNSEVGHLNLGAGAVVQQDLTRIDDAVKDGSFADNDVLQAAMDASRVHLLGLVSEGGVHASMDHLKALIEMAGDKAIVHVFTDGRDTLPESGAGYVETVEGWLRESGGRIASVGGRYYAMDRDKRWDRTQCAYDAIVKGQGNRADDAVQAIKDAYGAGVTDEFIEPTVIGEGGEIRDGDSVVFFNFRPDRARQMTEMLNRDDAPDIKYTCLTEYNEDWDLPVAFTPERPEVTLASTLANEGCSQLHVAETEKYAHVTYFFNGGEEHPYKGEVRELVDSPRDVPTYDHKPEMSARAATDAFVERWSGGDFCFGIINFANPDMVGHTGVIPAAVTAVEA
ncbi:MAG: 2,3-bisphosphoglycerate-independent phosphoglycerate mutase, partial [Thermoleophilales bacterium]|nr:2,3-bisphosphoglycerate-independent phosphoglycerate mutase [Thermoleophilales bacterium]